MLGAVARQRDSLTRDLTPAERKQIEKRFQEIQNRHKQLNKEASKKQKKLTKDMAQREALNQECNRLSAWLQEREEAMSQPLVCRLKSANVSKQVDEHKVGEWQLWVNSLYSGKRNCRFKNVIFYTVNYISVVIGLMAWQQIKLICRFHMCHGLINH